MSIQLSKRVQKLKPSATLAVSSKCRDLKMQGIDIIDLGVGEPDFNTPDPIKAAAITAIQQGFTKYTPVPGILELRKAVAARLEKDNQLQYSPQQIVVSCGGKQAFYNLAQVLLDVGDEVIIPAPYWVSFPDMVLLAEGKSVFIETDIAQQYKITPAQLSAAITPKTKLFVLNSPCNPTGMAYSRAELRALGQVLLKHPRIVIVTDDMYAKILWSKEPFCNIVMACPELYDRTVILDAVSKTYAMTGWRIGYAAGPREIIEAMTNIQGQSTSGACSISQKAALEALQGDQTCVDTMVNAFKQRHDFLIDALNKIPGVECLAGDGTFFAFPKVQGWIEHLQLADDMALADYLLNETRVAVVPGSAFGSPGHIRLSFATSLENLQEVIKRFQGIGGNARAQASA